LHVPFAIVDFVASAPLMRAGGQQRPEAGIDASDAGVAVLEHRLQTAEPLTHDERLVT
jgi:predicted kinase